MDPLSIIGSSIAVIQVSVLVRPHAGSIHFIREDLTVAQVTKTLRGLKQSIRIIDDRIDGLCNEINHITNCLNTVQETLSNCHQIELAPDGQNVWKQCDVAIMDCFATLSEVSIMAETIKGSGKRGGLIRKTKAVINWNDHNAELNALRDKLRMSHLALQTVLQTIIVSTSMRSYGSIHSLQIKLDKLKESIDKADRATSRAPRDVSHRNSDSRLINNLYNLLGAAKQFHASASSTAGSVREGTTGPWVPNSSQAVSEAGEFPPSRRRWVENYIRAGRHHAVFSPDNIHAADDYLRPLHDNPPQRVELSRKAESLAETESITSHAALYTIPVIAQESGHGESKDVANAADDYEDECNDAEAERGFQLRLQSLARDMIRRQEYRNAIDFLRKALQSEAHTAAAQGERRQLLIQLALCHLLQGNWQQAEVSVSCLSKARRDRDAVVCTLLHALALAHLLRYSFDSALSTAQRALQGRKSLINSGSIKVGEIDETRALLATIYKVRGGKDDCIRADVFEEQISRGFIYVHPKDEVSFIKRHPTLLSTIIGSEDPELRCKPLKDLDLPLGVVPRWTAGLPTHTLSMELGKHDRYAQDTEKYVVSSSSPTEEPMASPDTDIHPDSEASTIAATPEADTQNQWERINNSDSQAIASHNEGWELPEMPPLATVSLKSRWLRIGSVFDLRKAGSLLRKRSVQKYEVNLIEEPRARDKWFSKRAPRMTTTTAEQKVRCDDSAGHLSMDAFYSHSKAGNMPRIRYQAQSSHEMENTQVATPFGTQANDAETTQVAGIENMPRSQMNDLWVSRMSKLDLDSELSHQKPGQARNVSNHNQHGYADHGAHITLAEQDTASALLPNSWPMRWSNRPNSLSLPPTKVQSHLSGSQASMALLKSTSETAVIPWSTQRNTHPLEYSTAPHNSLWRPYLPYNPGALQPGGMPGEHVLCQTKVHDEARRVSATRSTFGSPKSGDCLPFFPINAAARVKHPEEHRKTGSPRKINMTAALNAHDPGCGTTITGCADSMEESNKSSWFTKLIHSLES